VSVIKLESKNRKPDLKVEYLGETYTLPGNISAAVLETMLQGQEDKGDEGFLRVFLADVIPEDFKAAIAQDDLAQLAKIWMEHIQGPKDSGSSK
jgi:hypothetical protein